MAYVLDANVVSFFLNRQRQDDLALAAQHVDLVLADPVRLELERSRSAGEFFRRWLPTTAIAVRSLAVGGAAHVRQVELGGPLHATRGMGERATIALAATDPTLVFVAHDKNALWLALRELALPGERLLGIPVFLRRLREQAGLDLAALEDVMDASNCPRPTWWSRWREESGAASGATTS